MSRLERYPLKVYGVWGGNPKGTPYDKARCAYSVIEDRGIAHQCQRKAGIGMWCHQHHPDSIQERRDKATARYEDEMDAAMRPGNMLKSYRTALRKISQGDKEPERIAQRVLAKWDQ